LRNGNGGLQNNAVIAGGQMDDTLFGPGGIERLGVPFELYSHFGFLKKTENG
jgi:hypothetical protein